MHLTLKFKKKKKIKINLFGGKSANETPVNFSVSLVHVFNQQRCHFYRAELSHVGIEKAILFLLLWFISSVN